MVIRYYATAIMTAELLISSFNLFLIHLYQDKFSKHNFFLKFKPLRLVCCLFGDQTVFVSILSFPLFAFEYNTIKSEKKPSLLLLSD